MKSYKDISQIDGTLRQYQQEAKDAIFAAWNQVDNVMFQMPTGTGKTRLFTSLIRDIIKNDKGNGKIIIIAHRKELIDQISASLTSYGIDHALFISGEKRNFNKRVQVASIASLTHPKTWKKQELKDLGVDYIIIDEAHHTMAKTYARLCKRYGFAKKLGVTATPWRMNHSGFMFFDCFRRRQEYFQTLIRSKPISWFIKNNYLSQYTYYSIQDKSDTKKLLDSIRIDDKLGDYVESDLLKKFNTKLIRAKLLDSYQKYANGKKGIVYAINQTHGKDICNQYQEAGLKVAYIDSNTKSSERKTIIERFRKGKLEILVNVNIFAEGFDCPDVEFIQLARPTKSLALYLQQVGRGLRKTENKSQCIILDNVGLYSTFGLPDANRQWLYHFKGSPVEISERPTSANRGLGTAVHINIAEGNEAMVMIQQITPTDNKDGESNKLKNKPQKKHTAKLKKPQDKYKCNTFSRLKSILIYKVEDPDNKKTSVSVFADSELGKQLLNGRSTIRSVNSKFVCLSIRGSKKIIRFNRSGVNMQKHNDDEIVLLSQKYNNLFLQRKKEALQESDPRGNLADQIAKLNKYRNKSYDAKFDKKIQRECKSYKKLQVNDRVISPRFGIGQVTRFSGDELCVDFVGISTTVKYKYPSCFKTSRGKNPSLQMHVDEKLKQDNLAENHHKRWEKAEEEKMKNLFIGGKSPAEIADVLHRSMNGILSRLGKLGLIKYQYQK